MNAETRNCENCKTQFTIEPDDFGFYEKMQVPTPTWCPECRSMRRMTWRNERLLYHRDSLDGKNVISCFSLGSGVNVYDRDMWWSDNWDPLSFGADYDFSRPFFKQYRELLERVPMPAMFTSRATNSDYCNHSGEIKDCYLAHAVWGGERLLCLAKAIFCKDAMDSLNLTNSELCYEVINSSKMYNSYFCQDCESCTDSAFLSQCRGCSNCFGCSNLRSKSYHIFNQPYTKEDYEKKIRELDLGSYRALGDAMAKFGDLKRNSLRKFANFTKVDDCTGDNLANVSNCKNCFDFSNDVKDCAFVTHGGVRLTDSYDGYGVGETTELLYESVDTGANGTKFLFDIFVWGGHNVQYSYASHGCQNLFGCIGLRNKQYCILNKQYTKEEYETLVPKIIEHMNSMPYADQQGRVYKYGEFFPPELSPFAYNETIAQEYYPLARGEAESRGFSWREPEVRQYQITKTARDLPDHIKDADDSMLQETIECSHRGECNHQCTGAFKLIPAELQFYRRMTLPLPRLCPNCRHFERLAQRNPIRLWSRDCMCEGKTDRYPNASAHFHGEGKCPNKFETPYAPDRPETVYCEQCYNAEVV